MGLFMNQAYKILINCSNLHGGGGVAVATSFIDCLSRMDHGELAISLLLSSAVHQNLQGLSTDLGAFKSCVIRDYTGLCALWKGLDKCFEGFDLVFTVFGPAYFLRKRTLHLFGFAQPNIIYPNNPISMRMGPMSRLLIRVKYELQSYFFSRADAIVVELEHVRSALSLNRYFRRKPIYVVHNTVHSIFKQPEKWESLFFSEHSSRLKLGVISRNYPHKNLAILADVKKILLDVYNRDVEFYVTFRPDEWEKCDANFRNNIINVGEIRLSQCPMFYAAMDGIVFPSLLECFSAVPIEAMMSRRPLFASNLPFVRDVCENYCMYFDPLQAEDIARVIHQFFSMSSAEQKRFCDAAYHHVQKFADANERARNYLDVIRDIVNSIH